MRRLIAAVTIAVAALTGVAAAHPSHSATVADILCCFGR
jgi:hypothetical protein